MNPIYKTRSNEIMSSPKLRLAPPQFLFKNYSVIFPAHPEHYLSVLFGVAHLVKLQRLVSFCCRSASVNELLGFISPISDMPSAVSRWKLRQQFFECIRNLLAIASGYFSFAVGVIEQYVKRTWFQSIPFNGECSQKPLHSFLALRIGEDHRCGIIRRVSLHPEPFHHS